MTSAAPDARPRLDVVMPIHNEAASVAFVVEELFERTRDWLDLRVIACEDGSEDETLQVLAGLAARVPLTVRSYADRRGYAAAVLDGLRAAESEWVLAMDSDGQCDPSDIRRLWAARANAEVVVGYRQPRRDSLGRRAASRAFGLFYRALFGIALSDPSSPFVLLRRAQVLPLLDGLGRLPYGLWWEFAATVHHHGLKVVEVPIAHRTRRDGSTRAFPARALPGVAFSHLGALLRLRLTMRRRQSRHLR